ncbi:hypothetical protein SC08_Contig83orf00805 [Clostridium butyricum]|nr:hypothetical protein SC08_Contig83orf00805 [Clostridium butyricum]
MIIVSMELPFSCMLPKLRFPAENNAGTDLGEDENSTRHKFSRRRLTARAVISDDKELAFLSGL